MQMIDWFKMSNNTVIVLVGYVGLLISIPPCVLPPFAIHRWGLFVEILRSRSTIHPVGWAVIDVSN